MVDWQLAKPIASAQECKRWLEGSKELVLAQVSAALETFAIGKRSHKSGPEYCTWWQ